LTVGHRTIVWGSKFQWMIVFGKNEYLYGSLNAWRCLYVNGWKCFGEPFGTTSKITSVFNRLFGLGIVN
jgi:hypothetical protein